MALRNVYERFLASPEADALAQESSLHYIASTTTHTHPDEIVKHLAAVGRAIKKFEKTLNVVEDANSLCLDIETKLEFVAGGGPYLPGVDESFVVDRTVTFPAIHIVQFDSQNKISQIRIYWDQGSLLKQIEIIGPRNRGWPIRDGAEQMRLINSSITAAAKSAPVAEPAAPPANKSNGESKRVAQVKKHTRDPHGSLSLFDPSSNGPDELQPSASRSSFATAKPRTHTYGDIFGEGEPEVTPPRPTRVPQTPKDKKQYNHFEFGEGDAPPPSTTRTKNYNHFEFGEAPAPESPLKPAKVRNIFEHEEELSDDSQEKFISSKKTNPKAANHFEFGEEPIQVEQPIRPRSTKHLSQWDFEDFVTPEKTTRRAPRAQEVRHFGWSDDEQPETPQPKPRVVQPRRDAAVHFKLQDQPTPVANEKKPVPVKGTAAIKRSGLYENHLYDEEPENQPSQQESKGPLTAVTNGAHRRKDFDSHWVMTDEPSPSRESKGSENKPVASDRMKAVKMMESHWDVEDEDNKPMAPPQRANRMSRNVNQRSWGFGDED